MNWLKQKLNSWLKDENQKIGGNVICRDSSVNAPFQSTPVLRFTVYQATGGSVVEFYRYDKRSESNDATMYIISNDQDFGERIAKIATLEKLKT